MPASVDNSLSAFMNYNEKPARLEELATEEPRSVYLSSSGSESRILGAEDHLQEHFPLEGLPLYSSESQEKLTRSGGPAQKQSWARHFMGWRVIIFGSWFNLLLFMIPIAWTVRLLFDNAHALVFSLCILALIPLVRLHDLSIAELAIRVGGSKTGLLYASMSNFIEIVVAISALRKCELRVVQSSLVGSILSKLLLGLGLCFFAGGMRFSEQGFNQTATHIHSSLLSISVGVLLLPAAYHFTLTLEGEAADLQKRDILNMSHGVSIVLIFIYVSYLAFQLWSHSHLYTDQHNKQSTRFPATPNISTSIPMPKAPSQDASSSSVSPSYNSLPPARPRTQANLRNSFSVTQQHRSFFTSALNEALPPLDSSKPTVRLVERPDTSKIASLDGMTAPGTPRTAVSNSNFGNILKGVNDALVLSPTSLEDKPAALKSDNPRQEAKEPQLSWFLTILLLVSVTMAVAVTADWFVESMDGISTRVNKDWIALIVLPVISSVAECITAIKVSVKDELSLSISVAVSSTIQTALFVIPFMVLLAGIVNKPLTLLMDPFQSLILYLSVQTTSYVIADGKSNWLEGLILISLYIIIAVAFWFYPGSVPLDFLVSC